MNIQPSSVCVCACGVLRLSPVKLNMPICWVMWSQVPGVPRACSLALSWSLINSTRSAIVFTFPFLQGVGRESLGHYQTWCQTVISSVAFLLSEYLPLNRAHNAFIQSDLQVRLRTIIAQQSKIGLAKKSLHDLVSKMI